MDDRNYRYPLWNSRFVSTNIYDRYDAGRGGSFKNDFDTCQSPVCQ